MGTALVQRHICSNYAILHSYKTFLSSHRHDLLLCPGGIPTACQHLHCQLMLELRERQDIGLLHLVVCHIGIQYSG